MKSQKFLWLFFPIALAVATGMYLTSCHGSTDELRPDTETVAPATDDDANTTGNVDDGSLSFRSCFCSEACAIDLVIVSGSNVNVTVCGDLNGTTGCATFTSSCGSSNYPFATTFTSSGCFCVEPRMSFRVTNNSLSNVTIDLVVTGSGGTYPLTAPITLTSGASQDFASPASLTCDGQAAICP